MRLRFCTPAVAVAWSTWCAFVPADNAAAVTDAAISAKRIEAHTAYLASDGCEGRAPGSSGETLALQYLSDRLFEMGYSPGNSDGTFLQKVPLTGTTITHPPHLVIGSDDGRELTLLYGEDYVGWTLRQRPVVAVEDAELVFVGFGVVAPEYAWDDFKDVDVRGKMVVVLVGDPPHPDETLFAGRAMTYYGRWTYKFEIAAEKGAAGVILVHTENEAGYPWEVVNNSWTGEQFDVVRADKGASRCAVETWVSSTSAEKIFQMAGRSFADARSRAVSRDFRPYSLGLAGSLRIENDVREVTSHNLIGILPGRDAELKDEYVAYVAHWDHLGIGVPADGDSIYNGALDNASGVAGVLEIARAFSVSAHDLKRSVLIVFTTAEESGLLGARYYVDHPPYPLDRTVAMINVDGLNIWGRTADVVVIGHGQSDLDDYIAAEAAAQNRRVRPDSDPEKGYYYRSDHFAFAKAGVPALYADSGVEFVDRPDNWGVEARREYLMRCYHKPQDEVDAGWDLSGAVEDMELLFRVGFRLAAGNDYPQWSESSEFRSAGGRRPDAANR